MVKAILSSKWFKLALAFLVILSCLGLGAGYWLYSAMNKPVSVTQSLLFEVASGKGVSSVCRQLQQQAVLPSCLPVKLAAKISPKKFHIKAGTYQVKENMTLSQLFSMLNQGKEHQFSFTIVEGDNVYQVIERIRGTEYISDNISHLSLADLSQALNLQYRHPEGFLAPDTYFYNAGASAKEILLRAAAKQKRIMSQLTSNSTKLVGLSPYEVLILASIVEKETSVPSERATIASVFYNRLEKGMRLQTDPTVIYGVWQEYEGDITRRHLRTKTPYNTYRIDGLPPTPIANPGVEAIRAVMEPEQSDYFYFVASGEGGHVFNRTLEQHNKAVQAYLKKTKS